MYDGTDSVLPEIWGSFTNKEERDAFAASHISTNIAAQIFAMREERGWTQTELADKAGMAQTRISVMENPSYESFSLSTLKRLASAFDVALIVRYVAFSELAHWTANLSPDKLAPPSFANDSLDRVVGQPSLIHWIPAMPMSQDIWAGNAQALTVPGFTAPMTRLCTTNAGLTNAAGGPTMVVRVPWSYPSDPGVALIERGPIEEELQEEGDGRGIYYHWPRVPTPAFPSRRPRRAQEKRFDLLKIARTQEQAAESAFE